MAPNTRRKSVFVQKVNNPTMEKFIDELKSKQSEMSRNPRPTEPSIRPKKVKRLKIPRVSLNKANERILPPKPAIEDPLQDHIERIRAAALTLRRVSVRAEEGIIIIDD